MSKSQFYQSLFLFLLILIALPGFYRAVDGPTGESSPGDTEHEISLSPQLQREIPRTRIDLDPTSETEKRIIRHRRKININRADKEELQEIPRVGPATAERIINHRKTHGEFTRKEELKNIPRIGAVSYQNMAPKIRISPYPDRAAQRYAGTEQKININRADEQELQT